MRAQHARMGPSDPPPLNFRVLRPLARDAIRSGFADRGWRRRTEDGSDVFEAPPELIAPPLRAVFAPEVHGDKFSGLRLGSGARVVHSGLLEVMNTFSAEARLLRRSPYGDEKAWPEAPIGYVRQDQLLGTRGGLHEWFVGDEATLADRVEDLFLVLDGALTTWLSERRDEQAVLERARSYDLERAMRPVRTITVLALLHERPDVARHLIGHYRGGIGENPTSMDAFEREVRARFPHYGDLQRS